MFVVHELTVYWDLSYSTLLRDVGPFEQMVHSFLEILPLLALALLMVVAGSEDPVDWSLRPKEQPLPGDYVVAGLLLVGIFNAVPLLQETWSCIRARRRKTRVRVRAKVQPGARPGEQSNEPAIEPTLEPGVDPAVLRLVLLRTLNPDEGLHVHHVAGLEAGFAVQVAADDGREGQQRLVDRPGRL